MKTSFSIFFLLLLAVAQATGTTVTGTVTDQNSVVIYGASVSFSFIGSPSSLSNGSVFNQAPASVATNGSGVFSIAVTGNDVIQPVGSKWAVKICPISLSCQTINVTISGGSQDISSQTRLTLTQTPLFFPPAYSSGQIPNPISGAAYWDLGAVSAQVYNGTAFVGLGTGGGGATLPSNALVFGLTSLTSRAATATDVATLGTLSNNTSGTAANVVGTLSPVVTQTANYTTLVSQYSSVNPLTPPTTVTLTGTADANFTLPATIPTVDGTMMCFADQGTGALTIVAPAGKTIDGAANALAAPQTSYCVQYSLSTSEFQTLGRRKLNANDIFPAITAGDTCSGTTPNTYCVTLQVKPPLGYVANSLMCFKPQATNTGASTFSANGLASLSIVYGTATAPIAAGQIVQNVFACGFIVLSGNFFELLNPQLAINLVGTPITTAVITDIDANNVETNAVAPTLNTTTGDLSVQGNVIAPGFQLAGGPSPQAGMLMLPQQASPGTAVSGQFQMQPIVGGTVVCSQDGTNPLTSAKCPWVTSGSAVSSVFGRTGAVVSATNDYNFSQLAGAATLAQLATQAADTLVMNATAGTASPTAVSLPACAADGSHALTYPSHTPTCTAITTSGSSQAWRTLPIALLQGGSNGTPTGCSIGWNMKSGTTMFSGYDWVGTTTQSSRCGAQAVVSSQMSRFISIPDNYVTNTPLTFRISWIHPVANDNTKTDTWGYYLVCQSPTSTSSVPQPTLSSIQLASAQTINSVANQFSTVDLVITPNAGGISACHPLDELDLRIELNASTVVTDTGCLSGNSCPVLLYFAWKDQ